MVFFAAFCILLGPAVSAGRMETIKPMIPLKAQAFRLSDVRLLDGPFRHAQELDRRYLRSLDPQRLLHNFYVNAGLPSSAEPLGGWEAPDCELRGHFVGHYLSACAKMVASTGDAALRHNAEAVVSGLARCQEALGGGYLSAFSETFLDRVEARQRVWAPWYTLHKILAGLLDMYLYCHDKQALAVAQKMAAWAKRRTDRLSDAQMQAMLDTEHGGMNEVLADLYAVTGYKEDLAISLRFNHRAVLDPLARCEDRLTGLHANTQISKVIGAARQYELTGDVRLRTLATFFWKVVTQERSYVIGGHSDGERFSPKEHLSHYLSAHTTETCNTYNMLKLTRHLFMWDPQAEYMDYYERALYNHILASQNPETGMMCYYVSLRPGSHKVYSTPTDSFWCCTGTGVENHAQYGDSIYFHDGGAALFVNLFIASELTWKAKGITLRQETRFPEEARTRLVFTCAQPVRLALRVRHPCWAGAGFRLFVNGKEAPVDSAPGGYAIVTREWKTGDTVEVFLPMALHTEAFRDDPRRLAILEGPIVLCGEVAEKAPVPDIVSTAGRLLEGLKPAPGQPLDFTGSARLFHAVGRTEGAEVSLIPFYETADRSYTVYWDVLTPDQFQEKERAYEAEVTRQEEIAARKVDDVHPGDRQSEREHAFAGEATYAGDFGDRHWRDARNGGWFSYTLKVLPGVPQELVCSYWGGDDGREFYVFVDGVKLATQRLDNRHPGKFFDVVYPIPPELLQGKQAITVRFQGEPGRSSGGVFGCMVLKQ